MTYTSAPVLRGHNHQSTARHSSYQQEYMDKTSSSIAIVLNPAADNPHAQSAEEAAKKKSPAWSAQLALVCLLRVGAIALMASSIARSAWRARGDPWELAFVAGPSALLAAIFLCLHRAERLAPEPESSRGERWRLQVAVWVLSTAMSCVLAYRVSLAMPAALVVVVVWCMTSFVVVVGFYMLVLCKDQQYYQRVKEDHDDAGDDGKRKPRNKTRPADELV